MKKLLIGIAAAGSILSASTPPALAACQRALNHAFQKINVADSFAQEYEFKTAYKILDHARYLTIRARGICHGRPPLLATAANYMKAIKVRRDQEYPEMEQKFLKYASTPDDSVIQEIPEFKNAPKYKYYNGVRYEKKWDPEYGVVYQDKDGFDMPGVTP